jgi:hypothetical protein
MTAALPGLIDRDAKTSDDADGLSWSPAPSVSLFGPTISASLPVPHSGCELRRIPLLQPGEQFSGKRSARARLRWACCSWRKTCAQCERFSLPLCSFHSLQARYRHRRKASDIRAKRAECFRQANEAAGAAAGGCGSPAAQTERQAAGMDAYRACCRKAGIAP